MNHSWTKRMPRSSTVRSTYSCWLRMRPPLCRHGVGPARSPAGAADRLTSVAGPATEVARTSSHAVHSRATGAKRPACAGSAGGRAGTARGRTCESAAPATTMGRRGRQHRCGPCRPPGRRTPSVDRRRRRNRGAADPGGSAPPGAGRGHRDRRRPVRRPARPHAALLGPGPPADRGRLRGGLRLRRLVDPGVPGDPGVGHAAHARPRHGGDRPLPPAQDAEHQLLRARPGHRSSPTPATRATWPRRPRPTWRRPGIADTVYFGPEAEFFIFDDVRYSQDQRSRLLPGRLDRGALEHRHATRARTSATRSGPRRATSPSRRPTTSRTCARR